MKRAAVPGRRPVAIREKLTDEVQRVGVGGVGGGVGVDGMTVSSEGAASMPLLLARVDARVSYRRRVVVVSSSAVRAVLRRRSHQQQQTMADPGIRDPDIF